MTCFHLYPSTENFQQAAQDYKEALTRKTAILPADHRELAEANYKLALALEFVESIQESIECVKAAVQILELHVANNNSTDITEVQGLLPDMKQKVKIISSFFCEKINTHAVLFTTLLNSSKN